MSMIKYRVHEVAKDFDLPSKAISAILEQHLTAPKNTMKVLDGDELDVIFDYLTSANQTDDLEAALKSTAASKPFETAEEASAKPDASADALSAANPATKPDAPKKDAPASPASAGPQRRVIDTRGTSVDMAKYDDRIDTLVPEKARQFDNNKNVERIKHSVDRRNPQLSSKRRIEEAEKIRRLQQEIQTKQVVQLKVMIPDEISVGELASRLKKAGTEVVKKLMGLGVMASISQIIDYDTAALVALDLGAKVEREVILTIEDRLIDVSVDKEEDLAPRNPVVVVMGHVDHGKTSLLDAIKKTNVVSGEAGGITQHIGAYQVDFNGRRITFLDTPGHAAFTSMRARGAQVTDIAILVVAADDGIMPQTIEAIHHAEAAGIPIIVAINKMDKSGANPDRIMQQLTEYNLVPEEWGGETIVCKVSAVTGEGLDNLLEMVILSADMRNLRANTNRLAMGTVIEAKLDRGRGPIATVLVQNGTLKNGDILIAGKAVGRVRAMNDDKGVLVESAGPSVPVEVSGLSEAPGAGDHFYVVENERMARVLVEQRKQQEKDSMYKPVQKMSLEDLFAQIQQGNVKELGIIVKGDVQGSVEAITASLEKLSNDEVRVRVIHGGVGTITESDIMLASASNAIIVGFNVRPDQLIRDNAARNNVDIRLYRVIYDCINEMEAAMKGMLSSKFREVVLGHAEIRQTFQASGIGTIAGCYVQEGKIVRASQVRIVRDGIVIHEGELASLKRFKDDVREVATGYECGMNIERFNDLKVGDIIEAFTMEEFRD